jgi:hypothetical protein
VGAKLTKVDAELTKVGAELVRVDAERSNRHHQPGSEFIVKTSVIQNRCADIQIQKSSKITCAGDASYSIAQC